MTVILRVDAGPDVGLGHLQRCLGLASALRAAGVSCAFMTVGGVDARARIIAAGFAVESLGKPTPGSVEDLDRTLALAARHRSAGLIVDSYDVGLRYLTECREAGLFVVAIDDLARFPFPCQMVVAGGAHAPRLPYRSVYGDTRFLLGPRYAMLRGEFLHPARRTIADTVRHLLVTIGGSGPEYLIADIVRAVDDLPGRFKTTVVVGPFLQQKQPDENGPWQRHEAVRVVPNSYNMRDLMLHADLAISAGGQTLYELAATGTPTVAIQIASNQSLATQALADEGVIALAGRLGDMNLLDRVKDEVLELAKSTSARRRMSTAGRRLVDGRGAGRVARCLRPFLSTTPRL